MFKNIGRVVYSWFYKTDDGAKYEAPVIDHEFGRTPEKFRRQAAINMRVNPQLREEIVGILAMRLGSRQAGEAEARRRYPEAFDRNIPKGA
jgi:hypothetical protein